MTKDGRRARRPAARSEPVASSPNAADPPEGAPLQYEAVAHWDRLMTRKDWLGLKPAEKRDRLALSLERKVAIIEAAAAERPGSGLQGLRGNMSQLREWEEPLRGLWRWSTRDAERSDKNARVIERFKAAVLVLRTPKPQPRTTKTRSAMTLREQLAEALVLVDGLRRQNATMVRQLAKRAPAIDEKRR